MIATPLVSARYETPFGDLHVLTTPDDGVVRASGFQALRDCVAALAPEFAARGHAPGEQPTVADAVAAWLAGDGDALARVPVEQSGGPFLQEVWERLRAVPGGTTVSYAELAEMAGRPRAMRAVGTACARNGVAPFVPCHRVVRTGGALGAYGYGGTAVKAAMLELEGSTVSGAGSAPVEGVHEAARVVDRADGREPVPAAR
ncbi:methylated-DNA--[protein]-cysteine S-methyltransferase [Demequina pelophila]|uniref:methylated-DNA--[protein]-cysteine S-methyltransferase n=1 Tax=Demequina pelophila TaxID=1638984 RepID=UPI0009E58D1F|nr:methylated-DNA--[protein]-cysteine S-methyltransferase [Demequina pelophila]